MTLEGVFLLALCGPIMCDGKEGREAPGGASVAAMKVEKQTLQFHQLLLSLRCYYIFLQVKAMIHQLGSTHLIVLLDMQDFQF